MPLPLRALFTAFIHRHLVAPAPPALPIAPVMLLASQRWLTHLDDPQALATLRQLIDQDMLRWLDRQPTYLSPELLLQVEGLLPAQAGTVPLTHEQWVALSHALVTYQIVQQQLASTPLLAGQTPARILFHLTSLRAVARTPLATPD